MSHTVVIGAAQMGPSSFKDGKSDKEGNVRRILQLLERGLQGRVKNAVDFVGSSNNATNDTVSFTGNQYEPYYAESFGCITSERNSSELTTANGAINRTGVDEGTIKMKTAWDRVRGLSAANATNATGGGGR